MLAQSPRGYLTQFVLTLTDRQAKTGTVDAKKAYADVKVANRTIKCLRGSELGCSHRLRTKTTSSPTIRPGPSARLTLFNEEGEGS